MRVATAVLLFLSTSASAAVNWNEDVRVFARELPKRHANAFHNVSREEFEREIAALAAKVPTANDSEMFVALSRITAMVGDGHTYVKIPSTARRLPIGISIIEGEYRVTHAIEPYRAVLGTRVLRIGSTPIDEAVRRLTPLIPQAESDVYVRSQLPTWLVLGEALHGTGITSSRDRATFVFARDDGTELSLEIAGIPWSERPAWVFASEKTPLPRQRPDEGFWFTELQPKTVYVAFRRYDDLRAKSRELWRYVDQNKTEKLIVDLRANGGGDYTKGREYLVDPIKKRPGLRTYALVGARTFSAAMNNAIDLRNAGAKLVGGTIGERPNSYQENDELTLPSSKLVVSYSTRFYKFLPDGAANSVEPDQKIEMTWRDFVEGRDPAVEWVLRDAR